MKRFQILLVAMKKRIQIEEELTEESPFDISDAKEQLILDMARDMVSGVPPIRNDSHTSPQPLESVQDSSSNDIQDQDQQQRDALYENAHKNQAHTNRRAVKE